MKLKKNNKKRTYFLKEKKNEIRFFFKEKKVLNILV